jgi:hypothetical protein
MEAKMFLWEVGNHLQDYTTSQCKILKSKLSPPSKLQISYNSEDFTLPVRSFV